MTVPLHDRKLTKRFQLMDIDGDGYITRQDYEQLISKLLQAYQKPQDSDIGAQLSGSYLRLWNGLAEACQVDSDSQITLDQFKSAATHGVIRQDGGFDKVIRPATEAVLKLADTNGDGRISIEEFVTLMGIYGVPADQAREFAVAVDTDGNGDITLDEVMAADRDFYLSEDPAAVGNLFFGRI